MSSKASRIPSLSLLAIRSFGWGHLRVVRAAGLNWAIVLLGLGTAQVLPAITLIVVARQVLPTMYGQYLACYSLLSLLIVLPSYGMDAWLLTKGGAERMQVKSLWLSSLRTRLLFLLVWLLVAVLLALFLPGETFPLAVMVPTALGLAFDALGSLSYSAIRALGHHDQVTVVQAVSSLILLGITLLLPLGADQVVLFSIVRAVVSALTALAAIALGLKLGGVEGERLDMRSIVRSARPFMIADVSVAAYMKADLTLVSLFIGAAGASIYGPAINLINMTFLVPNALYLFVLPLLSNAYARSRISFLRIGAGQLVAHALSGGAISLVIFFGAPLIVQLVFGAAYETSTQALRLLSLVPFIKALNFGLGAILTGGGRQSRRTVVQVVCAIFSVSAVLILIVPLGVFGVALVHTLIEALLFVGYSVVMLYWSMKGKRALVEIAGDA